MSDILAIQRRVKRHHTFAILLIAVLIIGVFYFTRVLIGYQQNDAAVINAAGKQRMLSQKIALHAARISSLPNQEARASEAERLNAAIDEFEKNHLKLTFGGGDPARQALSPEVFYLYFSGNPSLDSRITRYINTARSFLRPQGGESSISGDSLEQLLIELNQVVTQLELESNNRNNRLQMFESIGLGLILLTLLIEMKFIFGPLNTLIRGTFDDLVRAKNRAARLQKRAELANQAKSQFLANMSHELRTPLNGVFGLLDLAMEKENGPEKNALIKKAKSSGKQLLVVINDILDIAKIESKKLSIEQYDFSLDKVLDETLAPVAILCDNKGLSFETQLAPDLPEYLNGAGNRFAQILNNLLSNAVKFTESGKVVVKISCRGNDKDLLLSVDVIDTGIGLTEEQQTQVFNPFTQADNTTTRRFGGTGLGLTIVSELVSALGGQLTLESEPSQGSCFSFELPFKTVEEPPFVLPSTFDPSFSDFSQHRVAVVDDLTVSQNFVVHQLQKLDIQPAVYASAEAFFNAGSYDFDLFVVDLHMPDVDGLDLTRKIKANLPSDSQARFILLSAAAELIAGESEARGLFDYVFDKPMDESRFFDAVIESLSDADTDHEPENFSILVAEDNDVNAHIAVTILESQGYQVHRVVDGQQAVDACNDTSLDFDLILMDINMPNLDGYQATQAIRQDLQLELPIIALTANSFEEDKEKSRSAGMNHHLTKPLVKEELLQTIKMNLGESFI